MTPAQALLHQVTLDPAWPTLTPELRQAITEELEGVVPAHITGWRTPPCRDASVHPRHLVPGTGEFCPGRTRWDGWTDPDHNGCDARQDAIRAATTNRTTAGPCKITRADIYDRYTGRTYPHANPSAFDIDHVVALHDAWNSGAWKWTAAKRKAFASDPSVLVLTTASANRSKGDQDPSQWAPASHDGACFYARTYRAIKLRWRLHTTGPQRAAIRRTLATCTGTEGR
jgi:hypothetical protein